MGGFLYFLAPIAFAQESSQHPGRELFDAYGCGSCHSVDSVGGSAGPDLTYVGLRRKKEWLDLWLTNPKSWKPNTLMPVPGLPAKTRQVIADYLMTLKGTDSLPYSWNLPKEPQVRGRLIYLKAGCVACHDRQGQGGHPNNNVPGGEIPALAKTISTYTPDELKKKIKRGVKPESLNPNDPAPMVEMPAWGQTFSEKELNDLVSYLFTLGPKQPEETW